MYVTAVNRTEICVALITRDSRLRLEQALPQFPELNRRLAGADASSTERGAVTALRSLRRVSRGRTILIGDASGSVDAITGEGLSLSFHQAIALWQMRWPAMTLVCMRPSTGAWRDVPT